MNNRTLRLFLAIFQSGFDSKSSCVPSYIIRIESENWILERGISAFDQKFPCQKQKKKKLYING